MAPYRHPDPTAWLLPVDLESQRTPGTLCHAVQHLVDDLGVSASHHRFVYRLAMATTPEAWFRVSTKAPELSCPLD